MTRTSRRSFLSTAVAATASLPLSRYALATTAMPASACTLISEQEVGPFYIPNELLRSEIAEDRPGIPLSLHIILQDVRTCRPIPNTAIDLWHCDASGIYSGYTKTSLGPPPGDPEGSPNDPSHSHPPGPPPEFGKHGGGPPATHPTDKLTFCRGIQLTGPDGAVSFQTIVPGFYQGRTNHIHFKVRLGGHTATHTYAAGHTSHIGQIFFPEELLLPLMAQQPYVSHHIHRVTPSEDGIFTGQHGNSSIAHFAPAASPAHYLAEITIAVDPTATPKPVDRRPDPQGPGHDPGPE
ncbi:dioxygenase [Granulicella arctica]|uniref:Protocatechuate 3,4-dioxygenase beta subunit n=1 Tax=Granulicella arctica TaxID=940613 RepID=A0A7Y9TFX8_9BACT|nr:dioxygenase [Granulicella arctica]NYF78834.1 protocatechuate 3,4-dioxygenase beta subunit [Granulicella arctica]